MSEERADALVAAIEPGMTPPAVRAVDVVLVAGPRLAGTTSVVSALRDRIPEQVFVEELPRADAPAAVVFVVSAAAVLTESDCGVLDSAAVNTDLVIGVVSKIDAYRDWREVLAGNRALLAARARRYAPVSWVGSAAAPDLGEPLVDELVGLLRQRMAEPALTQRNRLRAWESHLQELIDHCRGDAAGADGRVRVAALHQARDRITRDQRSARAKRIVTLRAQLQQARVRLGYMARNRCASVRAELTGDVSARSRRRLRGFEAHVRERVAEVVDELDRGITEQLADVARRLELPAVPVPSPPSPPAIGPPPTGARGLETQLTAILGAGFGLGVALVVTRLLAGPAAGPTAGGLVAGGLVGLVLTLWVIGIRGLLHDRAVLDRWVTDVTNTLRYAAEEHVATRILAAETVLTSTAEDRGQRESAAAEDRMAQIDAELRQYATLSARSAVGRDRRLPLLQRALDAVRAERTRVVEVAASKAHH
ncbi:hypothetical protein [Mycobacterium sp. IDR2000157661]|uniref:hypothetical protein n=1 Tax=Mycobacterium sp. IDR2000157661 TaxID=2867005 RepID=UPI001EEC3110|nr:hypothetical protein [Mycobacterium sp. IDR2000157661]ULE34579.1 hypothetical protein K3G64_08215 [Mycobacterium sp. IDR2000157661]